MKFVRYLLEDHIAYGILEDLFVQEIEGSIFHEFQPLPVKHEISKVRLLCPAQPTKILCVGLNYRDHIRDVGEKAPEFPSYFIKSPTALIGPEDPIIYPSIAGEVEYEGELAVIMKDQVKDVSEEEALKHVLGYTCFNDVTDRSLMKFQGQLTRAKGFDTFGPCGPCIATDLDPSSLILRTYLNGRLMQDGHTRDLIFPVPFLIHYLSQCMTLYPGDIISTGTPKGVAPMKPGDIVEVSVKEIGTLRNQVQAPFNSFNLE